MRWSFSCSNESHSKLLPWTLLCDCKKAFGGLGVFADAFPLPPSTLLLNESLNSVSQTWWSFLLILCCYGEGVLRDLSPWSLTFPSPSCPSSLPSLSFPLNIHSSSMTWIRLYQTVAICFQLKYFLGSLQRFISIHCLLQHHKLYWNRATWNKYLLPHSVFGLGSGI